MLRFILAVLASSVVDCADCGDYRSEGACLYYNREGVALDCVYDGSASLYACDERLYFPSCSDFGANQTYCENNTRQLNCAWDWDAASDKCQTAIVYDCEYYNLSTETVCITNNGKFDCKYDAQDSSCVQKSCSDFDNNADDCNARANCLFDSTCKYVFCSNYSKDQTECYGNAKGLSCIYDGTCKQASCSDFDETTCDANNGKLDCFWYPGYIGTKKCVTKDRCPYFTTKDSCYSNNGALDCEWLSNSGVCNGYTCLSINNGYGDIPSESACLSSHPTDCRWEGGKCTSESGAFAMSVPSLVMLLLLLLTVFSS